MKKAKRCTHRYIIEPGRFTCLGVYISFCSKCGVMLPKARKDLREKIKTATRDAHQGHEIIFEKEPKTTVKTEMIKTKKRYQFTIYEYNIESREICAVTKHNTKEMTPDEFKYLFNSIIVQIKLPFIFEHKIR